MSVIFTLLMLPVNLLMLVFFILYMLTIFPLAYIMLQLAEVCGVQPDGNVSYKARWFKFSS